MVRATLDTKGNDSSRLSLKDLREALFNGEAPSKTDLDVLEEMAKDKRGLVKKVLHNKTLMKRAGNPDQLLHELDALHTRYCEELKTIDGARNFEKKVENQSWGKWAVENVKSVVLFPVRHPVITLLILSAMAAGIGFLYYGWGEALLRLIPNYSGKVVEVAKKGVKALSESMTQAAKAIHSGEIPFANGIGAANPSGVPSYESPVSPGIFGTPNGIPSVPPVIPPSVPSVPIIPPVGSGTVPVAPILPPGASPIGRELL